jgi:hypothetical protein
MSNMVHNGLESKVILQIVSPKPENPSPLTSTLYQLYINL